MLLLVFFTVFRHLPVTMLFLQDEDLQDIVTKITLKRAEYEEAKVQMADLKVSYEKAEREYKHQKEQINTIAEDADSIKVNTQRTSSKSIYYSFSP